MRAGLLHPAADCGHGRVPPGAGGRLGRRQLCRAPGCGHRLLRLVNLRLHRLPGRQPAAQPQGPGGLPRLPLLLCHWLDHPDLLAVAVRGGGA